MLHPKFNLNTVRHPIIKSKQNEMIYMLYRYYTFSGCSEMETRKSYSRWMCLGHYLLKVTHGPLQAFLEKKGASHHTAEHSNAGLFVAEKRGELLE
jgi:hypothetical protein